MLLALGWVVFARLDAWNDRGELRLAQQEIARGRLAAAHRRLTALAARPGALGGAADYWLGICEALGGRPDAALAAFARLPEGYAFDPVGAYHEAKANLTQGRLHAAERRLEAGPRPRWSRPGSESAICSSEIYQIEVRFDDAKVLLRASLADAKDPIRVLKELSNLELDRLPYDGLQGALEKAGQLAPEDDRVWLGKGRLAIEAGRWDEAADMAERAAGRGLADAPVWRAWIEWRARLRPTRRGARGGAAARSRAISTSESGSRCGRGCTNSGAIRGQSLRPSSNGSGSNPRRRGRWSASPSWPSEPASPIGSPSCGAARPRSSGRSTAYRQPPLARRAAPRRGRAVRAGPAGRGRRSPALRPALCMPGPSRPIQIDPPAKRPWPGSIGPTPSDSSPLSARSRAVARRRAGGTSHAASGPGDRPVSRLAFTDDAEAVGLRFVYDNAETPLHQLPEPFGGGLALLDYDGDGWLDVYCVQGGPFAPASQTRVALPPARAIDYFTIAATAHFEDVTDASGIGRFPRGHGHGVAVGDVDGDGHPDLFVTRWRSYALYRNKGDGTFEDITDAWGLGGRRDWPTSAALADLDGDGDLDLYVCHYAAWDLDNPRICRDTANNAYLNCNPLDCRGPARSPVPQ